MNLINKTKINSLATHPLQTWEWGEFRKEWGNRVERFDFGQITVHKLYFLPFYAAIFEKGKMLNKEEILKLREFAKANNILFVKIEPNIQKNQKDISFLQKQGFVPGKTLFTPTSFYIDLTKSEDELLKSFHSKTRYNIKLAIKKGVKVFEDNSPKAFNTYWKLTEETTKRQGFYAHTKRYHELMWKHLSEAKIAHLLLSSYKGETLGAWVIFKWKNFIYYPYGASSDKHKEVMAPNLLMWKAIKWGKKNGAEVFDLWGREPGRGFTKFKEGYGPKVVEFLGTWDLVCSPLYWGYRVAEWIRWKTLKLIKRLH